MVKFVGSTAGGKAVAEKAGREMKRGAFELGGSDAFIVLDDADLDLAVAKGYQGRTHTNGQACNNSKRFLIHAKVYDEFISRLITKIRVSVKIGDPMLSSTTIGPLA
jgi:succinate-semialdehyde dehydrogenase/glutarate-semialdehyde dehydrogenase